MVIFKYFQSQYVSEKIMKDCQKKKLSLALFSVKKISAHWRWLSFCNRLFKLTGILWCNFEVVFHYHTVAVYWCNRIWGLCRIFSHFLHNLNTAWIKMRFFFVCFFIFTVPWFLVHLISQVSSMFTDTVVFLLNYKKYLKIWWQEI